MNFRKKGWLKKYTDLRAGQPFFVSSAATGLATPDAEKALYQFLQPTGLFYGLPIQYPLHEANYPQRKYYATSDKARIIFLDCLFGCLMAGQAKEPTPTQAQLKQQFALVADYFGVPATTAAPANKSWFSLFTQPQNPDSQLEKTLKKHLNFGAGLTSFSVYFANSLLFLDIYGCMRYSHQPGQSALEQVKAEQEQLRVTALKLIAAAAHANGIIEKEESQIYFQFLRSAKLPAAQVAELRELYKTGISLAEIAIPETSWLVRRYLLEVAILTIMADNDISSEEEIFLQQLCARLSLTQDDLDQGMAALQTFLLVNEPHLHFFKDKSRFTYASERLKERITKVIALNKDRILQEIEESKEMVALIQKSKRTQLSTEEKTKVRQQLFDILKTVPMLAMLLIPGKMLIMPFLLQILPAEIYPSAFRE